MEYRYNGYNEENLERFEIEKESEGYTCANIELVDVIHLACVGNCIGDPTEAPTTKPSVAPTQPPTLAPSF
eukprot:CAMPEP_0201571818 /NCGR_PEP_ID=MMETSP0190_2-20130828/14764_1 /ASSEMBLY_ACC=CAM_ASM_000263 /TAXON_ID=37353 /ORGANISM="Rosalina sp." /LENGTH=70 /DNA_ID=CAMNT_0047996881 /DNA_START=98 /DNA_END=307 /DNA_ORIENTATION=+